MLPSSLMKLIPASRAAVSAGSSYRYIWFDRSGAEFNRMTIDRCADEGRAILAGHLNDKLQMQPTMVEAAQTAVALAGK